MNSLRILAVLVPLAMLLGGALWWLTKRLEDKPTLVRREATQLSQIRRLVRDIEKQATVADNATGDSIAKLITEARQQGEL